jgi:signal transduction histidine kinase
MRGDETNLFGLWPLILTSGRWLLLGLSMFAAMILIWLGVTIVFNAARRRLSIWLASGTVFMAGLFFLLHTLLVSMSFVGLAVAIASWWGLVWPPVIVLPFAWYAMCVWYAAEVTGNRGYRLVVGGRVLPIPVNRLERALFGLSGVLTLTALAMFATATPASAQSYTAPLGDVFPRPALLFACVYALAIVLSMALSIRALRLPSDDPEPGTLEQAAGQRARRLARPWLRATAAFQLVVSIAVGLGVIWLAATQLHLPLTFIAADNLLLIDVFDLFATLLISAAVVSLGQGIVNYEIFTNRLLPRDDLRRQWRNTLVLSAGFSWVAAGLLVFDNVAPVLLALVGAVTLALFHGLSNWRNNTLRDRHIAALTRIGEGRHLLAALEGAQPAGAVSEGFRLVCESVLRARVAYLAPVGPSQTLIEGVLRYPERASPAPDIADAQIPANVTPATLPGRPDVEWLAPLQGDRGVAGLLLIGARVDGGVYSQEQVEIARVQCERLLDAWSTAALATRLMRLQRDRLVESGVADRRLRRVIHDDVLPRVHAALLRTSEPGAVTALTEVHRSLAGLLKDIPPSALDAGSGLVPALHDLAEREMHGAFDAIHWQIDPAAEASAAQLPAVTAEVVFFAAREVLRNAARYGRGGSDRLLSVTIALSQIETELRLSIRDDGVGLSTAAPVPGRGHGLALHQTMLYVVGGRMHTESGSGVTVDISVALNQQPVD